MEFHKSITPEIRTTNGKRKYYYCNVEFDTYEAADAYIKNLDAPQTIQDIVSKFAPNINTKETIAEFINQQKIIEIQDLH